MKFIMNYNEVYNELYIRYNEVYITTTNIPDKY